MSVGTAQTLTAEAIERAMGLARKGSFAAAAREGERALEQGGNPVALSAMIGMFHGRAGDPERAIPFLESAHRARPDDVTIAGNLVEALVAVGNPGTALEILSPALATKDPAGRLPRLRAYLLQQVGDHEEASAAYRALVKQAPDDWESWNNLGNSLAAAGRREEAVEALRRALDLNPDAPPIRLNLALESWAIGREAEGEALLREALERDPDDAVALIELAGMLGKRAADQEVVDLLLRASRLRPQDAALPTQAAHHLNDLDRYDEAEEAYRRALAIKPAYPAANLGLAYFLEHRNREAELPDHLAQAKASGASAGVVAVIKALDHRRKKQFAEGLAALEVAAEQEERPRLEHLRGQLLDGLGRYDEAFDAFTKMNELLLADPRQLAERGRRYRDVIRMEMGELSSEFFARWKDDPPVDERPSPVFLVGFPRSGTTLLDTILLSHPAIEILEEEPALRNAMERFPTLEELGSAGQNARRKARDRYFQTAAGLTELKPGNLLVDKNPLHMNKLPVIRRLFPNAKIILALRHPCDVVLSCYMTNFSPNHGMANFLRLDTAAELYDLSFSYFEMASTLMGLPVHKVVYENIVADRRQEVAALLQFIGVPWDDSVLEHERTARSREHIKTASYSQVVEPIYKRAAGRWERYRKHLEPILPILEPWIRKHGYSV